MPISDQQDAMDAEIKNLRIDRSAKQKNGSGRGILRWILVSFGLSVLLGVAFVIYGRLNAAVEVETVRVRTASTASPGASAGATILNATGYIIAAHKIELASKVSGRVAWIGVEKGDKVKQGQVLARFASYEKTHALVRIGPRREDIDAMRAQVKQAEGSFAFAQTQLDNAVIRAPLSGAILERNVERGEFVTTGFVSDRGAKGYVVSMAD